MLHQKLIYEGVRHHHLNEAKTKLVKVEQGINRERKLFYVLIFFYLFITVSLVGMSVIMWPKDENHNGIKMHAVK